MPCGVSFLSLDQYLYQQVHLQLPWHPGKSTARCPSDQFIISSTENWGSSDGVYVWVTNKVSEVINLSWGKSDFRSPFLGFDPCIMMRLHVLLRGALWGRYAFHDHGAKKATERSHGPNTTSKGLLLMTFYQVPCSKGGHPFQGHHRLTVKPLTHGPCYTLLFLCKESTSGHAIRPPA